MAKKALGIGYISDSIRDLYGELFGKSGITRGVSNEKTKSQKAR